MPDDMKKNPLEAWNELWEIVHKQIQTREKMAALYDGMVAPAEIEQVANHGALQELLMVYRQMVRIAGNQTS